MASTEFLNKAYLAYFGRPVDPVGYWAFQNSTEQEVYEAFFASPESQNLYGREFGAAQINAIYNMLFGRDAEPAGLEYWMHQMELGLITPAGAALSILNGALNEDKVAIQNKLAASAQFTNALIGDTEKAKAYVGDAAAQYAREWLKTVKTFPASDAQVKDVVTELVDIFGPGVRGPAHVFTLQEVVASQETVFVPPHVERVVMWGYNPHGHDETGVDNTAGGNQNNLTNEGPADGGVPVSVLYDLLVDYLLSSNTVGATSLLAIANSLDKIKDITIEGVKDEVQGAGGGTSNASGGAGGAGGSGGSSGSSGGTSGAGGAGGTGGAGGSISVTGNGDYTGHYEIKITMDDGAVATAMVELAKEQYDFIHSLLFDAEGNSRLYEVVREVDPNDTGSYQVIYTYDPIVLTTYDNNGGTVEDGVVTGPNDDRIVAGRLELLHGAYIDAGGGYNTLEVDAKGTYAQPRLLENIQKVVVHNLPNVYTTAYGSGYGYLYNTVFSEPLNDGINGNIDHGLPSPIGSGGSGSGNSLNNSVLDLSRAVDLERLVITEGRDTGRDLGQLTIVGVRGNAVARFEGGFTQDVNLHYGEGIDGPITVELVIGTILANLNFVHNADALHLVSLGGSANSFGSENLGGRLTNLKISGDAALYINGDLDRSFQDETPITIDASENLGGVNLELSGSQNVTFLGSHGNDIFKVATRQDAWVTNDVTEDNNTSVTVVDLHGDNSIYVGDDSQHPERTYRVDVTFGDGNNNLEVDDSVLVNVAAGNGDNRIEIDDTAAADIRLGDGDNKIEVLSWNYDDTADPDYSRDFPNKVTIVAGNGDNDIDIDVNVNIGVADVSLGNGNNQVDVSGHEIHVTSGSGRDVMKLLGDVITVASTGADSLTVGGMNEDYSTTNPASSSGDGVMVQLDLGDGASVRLGSGEDYVYAANNDFPGAPSTLMAEEGSYIRGQNLTLFVDTVADLRAAQLSGITKVVLDDDAAGYWGHVLANNAQAHGAGVTNALLTLTASQFKAIGAENFRVDGAIFNTHAFIKLIVDESTSLTSLGVDSLPRNIDLYLEVQDGVTLTMTAEQLHTRVAQNGVTLVEDGNTDLPNGKVVITGGGLNFDPFNTSDTVKSVIDGTVYVGGSLSNDFKVGDKWYNVSVKSVVNGYNRPADAAVENVLTLDASDGPVTQGGFSTWHYNFEIVGDNDVEFTGPVALGMEAGTWKTPFTIDFSKLEGEVKNFVVDNFEMLAQGGAIYGNADKGYPSEVLISIAADEPAQAAAHENDNFGWDEVGAKSLVSNGVSKYTVVQIDGYTAAGSHGNTATIELCDTAQGIDVFALRGNWNDTLKIKNAAWGLAFELQGGGTAKADGPTGTANVGKLDANYMWDGADAMVNITHSVAGDTRTIYAAGINIDNADSIAVNVQGSANIQSITGSSLDELGFEATGSVTIVDVINDSSLTTIDASGVAGAFSATVQHPDAGFDFIGGAGGTTLGLLNFTASSSSSIDGGAGGAVLKIGDGDANAHEADDQVDLAQASLSNISAVVLNKYAELTLSVAQAVTIGAANFSTPGSDTATLNLVGLDGERFVRPEFASDIAVGVLSLKNDPVVTLHPETNLTGIGSLAVPSGTKLVLTMEQFQQLDGAGTISVDTSGPVPGSVEIVGVTQSAVGNHGANLDLNGITPGAKLTLVLAESVDLSQADLTGVDAIVYGDDMTLTLGDIQVADGVAITGGANSILKFTDIAAGPFESIDASQFAVSKLYMLNVLVDNRNVDLMFAGLSQSVEKVIYNDLGNVDGVTQTVTIEAGTTVPGFIVFNKPEDDVEVRHFVLNLEGGTEISGNLRLSNATHDSNLIPAMLQTVVINSTGTATNLLNGKAANVITGAITSQGTGYQVSYTSVDNDLLDVTINATQAFEVQGGIVFESVTGDDGVTANDDPAATAKLTVNGTADVTIGTLDTSDDDVDALIVTNNGTGTLRVALNAANLDAEDALSFVGAGPIVVTATGTIDLSNDDLSAVTRLEVVEGGAMTLSYAQLQALGVGNVVVVDGPDGNSTIGTATLIINGYTGGAFNVTALDSHFDQVEIVLADQNVTLDPGVDLTNVTKLWVAEGRTLQLTAAQFQQLKDNGAIDGYDTGDANTSVEPYNLVITGLTQADVNRDLDNDGFGDADDGFSVANVNTHGGNINITLGENEVTLGKLVGGTLVAGSESVLVDASGVMADFQLADNQTLGLVSYTQSNGLDVTGGANSTIVFRYAPHTTYPQQVDASGYNVTTLKALASGFTIGGNQNVEYSIDDLPSSVELRLYEDPAELGFLDPTYRKVVIEAGVSTPTDLIFNDWDPSDEVRTLDLTLEGGATLTGSLRLPTRTDKDANLITQFFDTLTIRSTGAATNVIAGDITTQPPFAVPFTTYQNNLLNVVIHAAQNLVIGNYDALGNFVSDGDIVFNNNDANAANDKAANLTIAAGSTGNVKMHGLDASDTVGGNINVLNVANNGSGTLTLTGGTAAIVGDSLEVLNLSGTGDIVMGSNNNGAGAEGVASTSLSKIDAHLLSGDLDLAEITMDDANFELIAGTGKTTLTVNGETLNADWNGADNIDGNADDDLGWSFDMTHAGVGSELHLGANTYTAGDLNIQLGANTTLFIDANTDWTNLHSLTIGGAHAIVLADERTLTLTAAQANGLQIVAGPDLDGDGVRGTVNIVGLGDAPVDLSGIAANIAGVATLEDDDVTLAATTNLGAFAIQLTELADTSASLAGQTIRFSTVAQADGRKIIVDEVIGNNNDSSANVVWLFNDITAPVDTSKYDAALGRLWMSSTLINNEGGNVESLFTTLPSTILRVEFPTLTALNILLASNSISRTMEFVNFTTVGNLTFSDTGANPEEHIENLTLKLGGEVTIGNLKMDDLVAGPNTDPNTVKFDSLYIESHRALHENHVLAAEAYLNDNDGLAEMRDGIDADLDADDPENTQPIDMNTVGNIGVGASHKVNLMNVYLDTKGVSTVGDGSLGDGARLTVGTITYENGNAANPLFNADTDALFDITGDNKITLAGIDTSDVDITGLTIDATGFTSVLDPVMHMDNTEGLAITNNNAAAGTINLDEVEGNELSFINAANFDGALNITLSQIDSTDDVATDRNGDGDTTDTYETAHNAFSFTAGNGVTTVTVKQVGANTPTLAAGSTWSYNFTGAAAGSSLTLDATASLAAGSNLVLTNVPLVVTGNLDLSQVNLFIAGGSITVGAGQSLTLSVAQAVALTVDVVGSGTVKIVGNADDVLGVNLGLHLKTVNVDVSGVTLTVADGVNPAAGDEVLELTLPGGFDDSAVAVGQNVVGSPNADDLVTANNLDNTLNGMGGNDSLTGGDDTAGPVDTFNTYVVASGTDTIFGLKSGDDLSDVADAIVASGGATAQANVEGDFYYATAGTTNTGATVALTATDTAANTDNVIDMSEAGGTSGYRITGSNFQTGGVDDDGNDTLIGSANADIINGGNWKQESANQVDVLTGNAGGDKFVFNTSVSSAATLTVATTTAGIDREEITITADDADNNDESMTVNFTVNGIADQAVVSLAAVDVTDQAAVTSAVISALDAKAGIAATAGAAGVVVVSGDNAAAVTITSVTVGGTVNTLAGTIANGTDVAQVSTLTVSGTPTPGDYYSMQLAKVLGGGDTADATADATPTTDEIAAGINATFGPVAGIGNAVAGSVVTFTDTAADDGGFTITTDTTAAFAGSGASNSGATDYTTADVIKDFVSGEDTITFGLAAGVSGSNYFEAAAVTTYATAKANADAAFEGTVQYYLTSATDLDGVAGTGQVEGQEGAGLLFVDANLDGNADLVVLLLGVTKDNFSALDIVAA